MNVFDLYRQKIPTSRRHVPDIYRSWLYVPTSFLLFITFLLCIPNISVANTYAEKQIAAFTLSRPGTEIFIDKKQELYQFLVKAFSGIYTSVPLAWDPGEPNDNAYAEHKPSVNRKVINIRVSTLLTPLDQIAALVYEAINAQNEKKFTEITEEAHKGVMTKTEFIHNILRLEHKSLKKTRAFLSGLDPYKNIDFSQTVFYSKMSGTPEDFDAFIEYLHRIKRKEYDVFKHYSDFYDFVIPPTKRWKANQKNTAAGSTAPPPSEPKTK